MFVSLFCFEFVLPLPVSVLPCLLCMVIVFLYYYRSSDFLVLTLFSCPRRLLSCLLPLYLWISDYLEFDLCLLTLPLPGPMKSVFFVHCASGSSLTFTPFTIYNIRCLTNNNCVWPYHHSSPNLELLAIKCRPFYLPREMTAIIIAAGNKKPWADALGELRTGRLAISRIGVPTQFRSSQGTSITAISKRQCQNQNISYPIRKEKDSGILLHNYTTCLSRHC